MLDIKLIEEILKFEITDEMSIEPYDDQYLNKGNYFVNIFGGDKDHHNKEHGCLTIFQRFSKRFENKHDAEKYVELWKAKILLYNYQRMIQYEEEKSKLESLNKKNDIGVKNE